jgi:hypothetical protein
MSYQGCGALPQPFGFLGDCMNMTTSITSTDVSITDFRPTLQKNRLKGLWKMMNGFHLPYLLATLSLAVSAF